MQPETHPTLNQNVPHKNRALKINMALPKESKPLPFDRSLWSDHQAVPPLHQVNTWCFRLQPEDTEAERDAEQLRYVQRRANGDWMEMSHLSNSVYYSKNGTLKKYSHLQDKSQRLLLFKDQSLMFLLRNAINREQSWCTPGCALEDVIKKRS